MSSIPTTAMAQPLRSLLDAHPISNASGIPSVTPGHLVSQTHPSSPANVNANIMPAVLSPKFLGLPAELRNMIYRYLLVVSSSDNRICVGTRYRCALPKDLATCKDSGSDAEDPYPERGYLDSRRKYPRYFFALWSVGKQIAYEARYVRLFPQSLIKNHLISVEKLIAYHRFSILRTFLASGIPRILTR